MPDFNDASLILALTERLREHQSWAGETHVQKAAYVLNRVLRVPIPFKFILYKHGPFSFDLRDEIAWMRSIRFLEWEVKGNSYGPSLKTGLLGQTLKKQFPVIPDRYSDELEFVAKTFAGKSIRWLERMTTAVYVTLDESTPAHKRAGYIHNLKPHVSIPEAEAAVLEADALFRAATGPIARSMTA